MFTGVKVFCATMVHDRNVLGEKVTEWMAANPSKKLTEQPMIRQSSDEAFHCITIILFYKEEAAAQAVAPTRRLKFGT